MVATAVAPAISEADLVLAAVRIRHRQQHREQIQTAWRTWLSTMFSGYVRPPFATYHADFWEWLWAIEAGQSSRPFVAIWPRGFGKSTSIEVASAVVAARSTRTYTLYVCATQQQADDHVQNVAGLFESDSFSKMYPQVSRRMIGKYGDSRGWRRNRLRTESGFTIDALGLDTAARGVKMDEDRPDLIIMDDIDDVLDSPGTVAKKITTLTKSIIPAGSENVAVLIGQNLIHEDGVVARLANGRADFLTDRIVSGPHPAITNLVTEVQKDGKTKITGGETTWPTMTIAKLQTKLNSMGITAFLAEEQHDVGNLSEGIFGHVVFRHCKRTEVPELDDIQVWVDPAVTDTDQSDAHGIQADGISRDGTLYRLYSWEARTSPEDSLRRAIRKARELKASCVGVETDQGGDTWASTYELTWRKMTEPTFDFPDGEIPPEEPMIEFRQAKAGAIGPKSHRGNQMLAAYERGEIIHVETGTQDTLERALRRYLLRKPYDLVDAGFWSWYGLAYKLEANIW